MAAVASADASPGDRALASTTASSSPVDTAHDRSAAADDVAMQPRRGNLPPLQIVTTRDEQPLASSPLTPPLENTAVGPHNFEKIRILGAGATGRVYLVKSVGLPTEELFAMKVVKKSELVRRNRIQRVLTEKQVLSVANHPFVVTLHYSFQTAEHVYFIMQYCAGGEFFSFLRRQEHQRLPEAHAQFYAAEVLLALEYLHLLGIIYRDLKPENILVHESGHVVLSDFDLAHALKSPTKVAVSPTTSFANITGFSSSSCSPSRPGSPGSKNHTGSNLASTSAVASLSQSATSTHHDNSLWFRVAERKRSVYAPRAAAATPSSPLTAPIRALCKPFACLCGSRITYPMVDTESHMALGEKRLSFVGTHEYVAPEIIAEEGYVGSVDWWAFGILLYEMIYGTTPFKGATQLETLENILDVTEDIDFPPDIAVSDTYKDLVRKLLDKTVARRLQNPLQIKAHPFFQTVCWPLIRNQKPPIVPAFVHTLEERTYSAMEIDVFDNEVPYAAGVSSPNTPRRKQASRTPSGSPRKTASAAVPAAATADLYPLPSSASVLPPSAFGWTADSPANECLDSTAGSEVSAAPTAEVSGVVLEVAATSTSDAPNAPVDEPPMSLPNFDYSSSPKRGHWDSQEANRVLLQKLSELRLAVPEAEPDDLSDV